MNNRILSLLSGNEQEFLRGLIELGWYDYPPTLTDHPVAGKARANLNALLRAAGQVRDTDAWVYRLDLPGGKWQDAVAIAESHLKQEPQFAVIFCNLAGALLILVPSNPDKAFHKAKSGLAVDRIYLDLRQPSNFETETIKKLQDALKDRFRHRLQQMVNTERVTKKFYTQFNKELGDFQKRITGITVEADKLWYSSVMLNRLMFIYFLQRKGFLDGDRDYLSNRLTMVQERRGKDEFQSFYRTFLLRLFHEGLGSKERKSDFEDLLGRVPYLNGGLFDVHEIESRYVEEGSMAIDIPDEAFERIFAFLNQYEWCLDTRPTRTEKEINPDVLGYIFEKYINQKQMGAYYTKEDITEYIAKSTIIPYLFDSAAEKYKAAFEGDDSVWQLLQIEPDRYIYDAVQKGVELDLPEDIACGLDDVSRRGNWNTPAPEEYALPTEIWREVVARRKRHQEVSQKMKSGEVRSIDGLITLNLNMTRFARDVIDITDGPELIRALWSTMAGWIPEAGTKASSIPAMSVLDPTCGSGAFLFAALNILEPLYEACLDRMQALVAQADSSGDYQRHPDFRSVLAGMNDTARHPNREYFILKSIILSNLYGVDIMKEAVEICKLRLFLKMASVVEPDESRDNYGLEPLPDIDFNIRAGNTLVGYTSFDDIDEEWRQVEVEKSGQGAMAFSKDHTRLRILIGQHRDNQELFREVQLGERQADKINKDVMDDNRIAAKAELDKDLWSLYKDSHALADRVSQRRFIETHQPFHWFLEFPQIMENGGFDVIIGNPPYVEYKEIRRLYAIRSYRTESCGNLYAYIVERSVALSHDLGRTGMIIPVAAICTDGYSSLQKVLLDAGSLIVSGYNDRPGKLFDGLEHIRLSIVLHKHSESHSGTVYASCYNKWQTIERPVIFQKLAFADVSEFIREGSIPKLSSNMEAGILRKLYGDKIPISRYHQDAGRYLIHYTRKLSGFVQILDFVPAMFGAEGQPRQPSELKSLHYDDEHSRDALLSVLNSSTFYWWLTVHSDCRNLNRREVSWILFDLSRAHESTIRQLCTLSQQLMADLRDRSKMMKMRYERLGEMTIQCIYPKFSKGIIDEIDRVLARHYGFSDEELEFIINYDIKYRMGINGVGGDGEAGE